MNRIYQGRVTNVQLAKAGTKQKEVEWEALPNWEEALWNHHQLFQDAVNYYIVALASLGVSPESKLTKLRELLIPVWQTANKKGERREGMQESLKRTWQLAEPPTLEEAVARFTDPIKADKVPLTTAEKAGEFLLHRLENAKDSAIQQGGRDFLPRFCDVEYTGNFLLSPERRARGNDEKRLQIELYKDLSQEEIVALAKSITLGSVVNLRPGVPPDTGDAAVKRLREAAAKFPEYPGLNQIDKWIEKLDKGFSLPKTRGGNIKMERVNACILFLAFPNATTKEIFRDTFNEPKPNSGKSNVIGKADKDESYFLVDGDDPIKLARGTRGHIFPGFTALPIWNGDGIHLRWKEFDIAAFKEALKVYNQFNQNIKTREEKLDAFALKLLVMDGERALDSFADAATAPVRERLERLWKESNGKPQLPKQDSAEADASFNFCGDPRIDTLRQIINDDLAEEYHLTNGRRSIYGLRERTIKGWTTVKRRWQTIVKKGECFSEEKRAKLKAALDELRGGEQREQIGSHKLFEALISSEAAWNIWREPDDELQEKINKNNWAVDALDAFRDYCETCEALETLASRPLNFTPADAKYSRRLFMFTDACSFGSPKGKYKHDLKKLAVTVPVALQDHNGAYEQKTCRLVYSAPRLLRDQIRSEDGSLQQDWLQPMMLALLGEKDGKANPQKLADAAVQLMPDFDVNGKRRILLNFPLNLSNEHIRAQLGKEALWQNQFKSRKKNTEFLHLLWPEELPEKISARWWEKVSRFRVLAADLGTRHAATVALLECSKVQSGVARFIGKAGGHNWFARYHSGTILRLPGEDAKVLRKASPLEKDEQGLAFREELHGSRGRLADDAEWNETFCILEALGQTELLGSKEEMKTLKKRFSFPELNDKLLVAVRRTQSWIANCISWHWKLTKPETESQRESAIAELQEQKRMPEWAKLAEERDLNKLGDAIHAHIIKLRGVVQEQLLKLTHRILPLRNRHWEWIQHPEKADCHLLTPAPGGPGNVKLRGQRGLSMARIEQISELRRRWQSLNQSLRRKIGDRPPTASEMRNDPIPDPCPHILTKLENIREQRVNQTAHLIIAQALGLRLRKPTLPKETRKATDTHGEYEVARDPVDFIVMEDLSRYLSDQGRARSENTRLMKWCHRAVLQKVKMLAEPFGIPVLETSAAYSSRFCSLTGVAGFRAVEVGWDDRHEFRWRVLLEEAARAKAQCKQPFEEANHAIKLFAALEKISRSGQPNRTLLAPQPGGPIFVTAKRVAHPAPSPQRKQKAKTEVLPTQADLNAAVNLALRTVAHPACADIHHRIRAERQKRSGKQPDLFQTKEQRRFGKETVAIHFRENDLEPKERNCNLFYDREGVANFGRARLGNEKSDSYPYASGPGLWKKVNDRSEQWKRCNEINALRCDFLQEEDDDHIPM